MIVPRLPARIAVGAPGEREPNVHRPRRKHLRRHHADDRVRLIAEVHRFAKHIWIAVEHALPELVADRANHRAADAIFFLGEHAPELRLEADDAEKIPGHQSARNLFRRATLESTQIV